MKIMQKSNLEYCKNGFWILIFIVSLNIALTAKALSLVMPQKNSIPLNIRVMFDLKERESLSWDGTASVTQGSIDGIKGIGFEHDDKIYAENKSWRCLLTKQSCGPCGEVVTTKGIMFNITSPLNATFVLATKAGNFCLPLNELCLGKTIERYNGHLQIGLAPRDFLLSANKAQDDCPSVAVDKFGKIWSCWVSYKKGEDRILIKKYEQDKWSDEIEVTKKSGKYYTPEVTRDSKDGIWVVWSAYENENWDLYARNYNGDRWSKITRLTNDPSNDINPKIAIDPFGKVRLCWESYRNGNADIFTKYLSNNKWSQDVQITKSEANDRQPDLAIDNIGKTYTSWSRFNNGLYKILVTEVSSRIGTEKTIAVSPEPLAHSSIACARNKVWIAWDEMKNTRPKKAESDTKNFFYAKRKIGLRCYQNGVIFEPATDIYKDFPFPLKQHGELPNLIVDTNGRLWVFFHNYVASPPNSVWRIYAAYYQGDEWSQPILLPYYTWKNVASVSSCCDNLGNIWVAWGSDSRDLGSNFLSDRDVYVGYMTLNDKVRRLVSLVPYNQRNTLSAKKKPGGNAPRIPDRSRIKDQDYKLVWGSLYQPNNVRGYSGLDGFITEIYRTFMDKADLDFMAIGNYFSYDGKEYTNWLAEKANYLFSEANQFISITIPEEFQDGMYKGFNDLTTIEKPAIIGAYVTELSPEAIREAINNKRFFLATDKIMLKAKILGRPMGDSFTTRETIPKIDVMIAGTEKLYQIDILRNDACIYSRLPEGKYSEFSFLDAKMPQGTNYYSIQVVQDNGVEARTLTAVLNAI